MVRPGRQKQILEECKRKDSHFVCHKATLLGQEVCCRGFYDRVSTNPIRIMQRLDAIEFIDPSSLPKIPKVYNSEEEQ